MNKCHLILITLLLSFSIYSEAYAWDGHNLENNNQVEIQSGNLVRRGNDIEIYDWEENKYYDVTVENINRYGNTVEIEVYNWERSQYETYEMED